MSPDNDCHFPTTRDRAFKPIQTYLWRFDQDICFHNGVRNRNWRTAFPSRKLYAIWDIQEVMSGRTPEKTIRHVSGVKCLAHSGPGVDRKETRKQEGWVTSPGRGFRRSELTLVTQHRYMLNDMCPRSSTALAVTLKDQPRSNHPVHDKWHYPIHRNFQVQRSLVTHFAFTDHAAARLNLIKLMWCHHSVTLMGHAWQGHIQDQ